ncbi:hypothetical protein [Desulfovibrio cuneatus]|uniref:hypothetical protein n=1 Tax=Desulfovibrio cuneatus TaxID=159728 RepID=UPI00042791E8|nr:hypothetical protein [Desulfovibrio cuneatus]
MKPLVKHTKWWLGLGVLVIAAVVILLSRQATPAPPDIPVLVARFERAVVLGWGWLHAENTQVSSLAHTGNDVTVALVYTVVVDKDAASLNQEEKDRFAQFLPMCASVPLQQGSRCQVTETMQFTQTPEFGLMPAVFVAHRPEMLPAIAGKTAVGAGKE